MTQPHFLAGILSQDPTILDGWKRTQAPYKELCIGQQLACFYSRNKECQLLGIARDRDTTLAIVGAPTAPPSDNTLTTTSADCRAQNWLARYRKRGTDFISELDGHYTLFLYDAARNQCVLAADAQNLRSWFYRDTGLTLEFASSLPALHATSQTTPTINRKYENFFLSYGYYPFNETVYSHVKTLAPGNLLIWSHGKCVLKTLTANPPVSTRNTAPPDSCSLIHSLHNHFERAVITQSAQSNRSAVLLGGVDSALVASMLARQGKAVETFSFSYKETHYNQPHAEHLAKYLGIRHHWIKIDPTILATGMQDYGTRYNAPSNWPNYIIQTDYLCKQIRKQGFTHCFTGDGCDAIFMGYPTTYTRTRLITRLPTVPQIVVKSLLLLLGHSFLDRSIGHPYRVVLNLLRSLGRSMPTRLFATLRILDDISLRALNNNPPPQAMETEAILNKLAKPHADLSPLRLGYMGKAMVSPNRTKIIGSEDNSGLVLNSPYFDTDLKHFALQLNDQQLRPDEESENKKQGGNIGKKLLLQMAEQYELLPTDIIYQPKVAAVIGPIDTWYRNELKEALTMLIDQLPFDANPDFVASLFRDRLAERLYREHLSPSGLVSDAMSLLTTYASFNRP